MAGVYLLDEDGVGARHRRPQRAGRVVRLPARSPARGSPARCSREGRPVTTSDYEHELTAAGPRRPPGRALRRRRPDALERRAARRALDRLPRPARRSPARTCDVLEAIADLAVVACHNAEAYDDIRTAASTDALTGLLNHGAMQVRVREEIARAAREEQPLCCVLIDLDDFKRVNDELGHPAGDALLRRVADALRAEVRPYDQVARYGGDEFVLVLPGAEEQTRAGGRRARPRARPGRRAARARRAARRLLDRRVRVAAGHERRRAARRRRPRAAARQADRQGPRRGRQSRRRGGARPAAARATRRRPPCRRSPPRSTRATTTRTGTPSRSSGWPPASRCCSGHPRETVERIGHAALLHDVGKLAIPYEILRKAGSLDDAEWHTMSQHPVIGEGILRRLPQLAPLAPIVRHEHEHWDGSGYPDGLAGAQIPIGSRIILACDAYVAMTTRRPYRRALGRADAVARAPRPRGHAVRPGRGRGAARRARRRIKILRGRPITLGGRRRPEHPRAWPARGRVAARAGVRRLRRAGRLPAAAVGHVRWVEALGAAGLGLALLCAVLRVPAACLRGASRAERARQPDRDRVAARRRRRSDGGYASS